MPAGEFSVQWCEYRVARVAKESRAVNALFDAGASAFGGLH